MGRFLFWTIAILIGVPIACAVIIASASLIRRDVNFVAIWVWGPVAILLLLVAGALALRQAKGDSYEPS